MSEAGRTSATSMGYWSGFLGIDLASCRPHRPCVVPHRALAGYAGAWLFAWGSRFVISLPPRWVATVERVVSEVVPEAGTLDDLEPVVAALAVTRRIGPAVHMGIAQVPVEVDGAHPVTDAALLTAFQPRVAAQEWEDAGIDAAQLAACVRGAQRAS